MVYGEPLSNFDYKYNENYNNFKKSFSDFYSCKFENRNLKFCDNLSTCILKYFTKNNNYK